jgi:hypothetical protein
MGIAGVFMNAITWIMKPILITACALVVIAASFQNPITGSNIPYPINSGTPQVNNIFPILFQDPMRTPRNPKTSGPVTTVDGSNGKHRGQHKFTPAKKNGFTTNRRTKGVKGPKRKVSREKGAQ